MVVQLSQVQQTMLDQLRALNPLFMAEFGVKSIVKCDENRIRLHTRNRGTVINIDITYNYGTDLYDIKAYKLVGKYEVKTVLDRDGIFCDQLDFVLDAIMRSAL